MFFVVHRVRRVEVVVGKKMSELDVTGTLATGSCVGHLLVTIYGFLRL